MKLLMTIYIVACAVVVGIFAFLIVGLGLLALVGIIGTFVMNGNVSFPEVSFFGIITHVAPIVGLFLPLAAAGLFQLRS